MSKKLRSPALAQILDQNLDHTESVLQVWTSIQENLRNGITNFSGFSAHDCTEDAEEASYKYEGLSVTPLFHSKRQVSGGTVIDIKIHDPRSTITYATVNIAQLVKE